MIYMEEYYEREEHIRDGSYFIEEASFNDEDFYMKSEIFTEASSTLDTKIISENLYPYVEKTLSTTAGDHKFKQLVGRFMDKNNDKLHTPGPMYMIAFTDKDKEEFSSMFGLSLKEILAIVEQVISVMNVSSEFKLLRNNPQFWLFYEVIRYYTIKKDERGINVSLAIYALASYPSVFSLFYPNGLNESVMLYTIDNLTEQFIVKKEGNIFNALFKSISNSYDFLKPYFKEGLDKEVIRFIQRIRNDQKSMMKAIWKLYKYNYDHGYRITTTLDSNSEEVVIDDTAYNKTSNVEFITRKVCLPILTDGVDLRRAGIAAKNTNVSISDLRLFMSRILTEKHSEDIEKFISAILFLYLYDENKQPQDINSSEFIGFALKLFRRTNTNDSNVNTIKNLLNKWSEEVGVYEKVKHDPSRINYKRAIFMYFIYTIQYYTN